MQVDNITLMLYAISNAEGSSKQLEILLKRFGSLENLAQAQLAEIQELSDSFRGEFLTKLLKELSNRDLANKLLHHQRAGIQYIPFTNSLYPEQLNDLYDPPVGLFCRGNPELLSTLSVAIVGTRKATKYGAEQARKLGADLATMGITMVSGLAVGIDTAAHKGVLDADGDNISVLGTGIELEQIPKEQRELYLRILDGKGCIVSEYPMGYRATQWSFPRRNRIIAALALATVVVEAPVKSGALITARHAIDIGREILAMPGPITYESFRGCHYLIRQGASVYEDVTDVINALRLDTSVLLSLQASARSNVQSNKRATVNKNKSDKAATSLFFTESTQPIINNTSSQPVSSGISLSELKNLPTSYQQGYPDLTEEEKEVLFKISYEMTHINDLTKELNMVISKVSAILTLLEISGYIKTMSGGFFKRIA